MPIHLKPFIRASLLAAITLSGASITRAQTSPEPEKQETIALDRFVVTGSHLDASKGASPVMVVTSDEIVRSGISSNVLEVLRKQMPAFSGSGNLGSSNASTGATSTYGGAKLAFHIPVDHHALIAAANRPAQPRAKSGAQGTAGTRAANEVVEILRENARIQAQFEKPLDLTPRSNRRLVDYLILMILVNGFFIWRLLASQGDPTTMVYSFSGIILFSVGITWVMYGVMDRY